MFCDQCGKEKICYYVEKREYFICWLCYDERIEKEGLKNDDPRMVEETSS